MAGIRALRKIQLGREGTAGTATSATVIYRGVGTISDDRVIAFGTEDIGVIDGGDRSFTPELAASLSMDATESTFEQLPYILAAGIKATTAASTSDNGSGKVYVYPLSTTTQNAVQPYTIEGGDNNQAERMEYAVVKDFTLDGQVFKPLQMSANWIGRQVTANAFTALTTAPVVDEILFGAGKLYIDDTTAGSTQVSGSLKQMTLKVVTGIVGEPSVENLYFTTAGVINPSGTLDLIMYHDSNSTAEKANWRNEKARVIRLQFAGPALTTAGTTYTTKLLRIDAYGKWTKFDKIGEDGGHDMIAGHFELKNNSTVGKTLEITVVNELASLT